MITHIVYIYIFIYLFIYVSDQSDGIRETLPGTLIFFQDPRMCVTSYLHDHPCVSGKGGMQETHGSTSASC